MPRSDVHIDIFEVKVIQVMIDFVKGFDSDRPNNILVIWTELTDNLKKYPIFSFKKTCKSSASMPALAVDR